LVVNSAAGGVRRRREDRIHNELIDRVSDRVRHAGRVLRFNQIGAERFDDLLFLGRTFHLDRLDLRFWMKEISNSECAIHGRCFYDISVASTGAGGFFGTREFPKDEVPEEWALEEKFPFFDVEIRNVMEAIRVHPIAKQSDMFVDRGLESSKSLEVHEIDEDRADVLLFDEARNLQKIDGVDELEIHGFRNFPRENDVVGSIRY
jgi:hypothetical protein